MQEDPKMPLYKKLLLKIRLRHLFAQNNKDAFNDTPSRIAIYLLGAVGIILILISALNHSLGIYPSFIPSKYADTSMEFIRDIGIAVFSAALITLAIELRNVLDFAKKSLVKALTSNAYLESLGVQGLLRIKEHCNQLIWQKRGHREDANLNQSLTKLEAEIADELSNPFYEFYRLTIDCTEINLETELKFKDMGIPPNTKAIKKTLQTHFKIINPKVKEEEEELKFSVNLYCPDYITDTSLLNTIDRASYKSDLHKDWKECTNDIKYFENSDYKPSSKPTYNKQFYVKKNSEKPFVINYNNEVEVKIEETRYVLASDAIYTRKMNKPSKSTLIIYTYHSDKITLKGDCFGTLKQSSDEVTISENINSVIIESRAWLLPGNGISIVHMPVK